MKSKQTVSQILSFINASEKLKTVIRHCCTSDENRMESVAEHSWMLALVAIILLDQVRQKVDKLKVIKMVVIHDLAEAITGDIPSHENSERQKNKEQAEINAMEKITFLLPKNTGKRLMKLWQEFEKRKTIEAKLAQAIDKAEAVIQHNIAGTDTWDQGDYNIQPYYKDNYFNFNKFIRRFKDQIDNDTMELIFKADVLSRITIKNEHQKRYKSFLKGKL